MQSISDMLVLLLTLMFVITMIRCNKTVVPATVCITNVIESNLVNYMDMLIGNVDGCVGEVIQECEIIPGILHNEIWVRTTGELFYLAKYYSSDIGFNEQMFIGKTVPVAKEYVTDYTLHYLRQLI